MVHILAFLAVFSYVAAGIALPKLVHSDGREVSTETFDSLEELARIIDIAYCVGISGIQKPFQCLSRCHEFKGFELVTTWNTGPLLSDSCGYIAISHPPYQRRVIVAFRGTYSITNTIVDLSTNPAAYTSFPNDEDDRRACNNEHVVEADEFQNPRLWKQDYKRAPADKCNNCTVHSGFLSSWRNTRCAIIPHVERALRDWPGYELTLVGHSLGGAVAALAALEFQARGWAPHVTTFGEPRVGNRAFAQFVDRQFNLDATGADDAVYRRVTHVGDPVPLLPPEEWGYRMHAGEIYISKSSLSPTRQDLRRCFGDEDSACIEDQQINAAAIGEEISSNGAKVEESAWPIPPRFRLWELFFAHRDYFHRLGLCVPSGGPWDWFGPKSEDEEMTNYEL